MTLIEIDKSSIVKNQNAHRTSYSVPGPMEINGYVDGEIPIWLKDKVEIISQQFENSEVIRTEFYWNGEITKQDVDNIKCVRKPKIQLNIEQQYYTVESSHPEPTHHYKYLNTPVPCDNCSIAVPYNQIESEDDWEGYYHDKCPFCKDIDTFEYKLQALSDVI